MTVSLEMLKGGFSKFLFAGMKIVVHSSLSSLGRVSGGADAVVSSLKEIITPSGLVMMPVFTYGRNIFNSAESPSGTGLITEEFRKSEGVRRSLHPTHSVCAWGARVDYFLSGHQVEAPFSYGTPLHKLATEGGYVLLIGVSQEANSMIHVAQELAEVPYLDRSKLVQVLREGRVVQVRVRRAGCSLGFGKAEPFLRADNLVQFYKIGQAQIRLMKAKPVLEKLIEILKSKPLAFRCDNKDCFACNEAAEIMKANIKDNG